MADLLLIGMTLTTLAACAAAVSAAALGRWRAARRTALALALGWLAYLATAIGVAAAMPQRIVDPGEPWCFDDWCLALDAATVTTEGARTVVTTDLRLISRARRVSQRANGAWIYLVDASGQRHPPEAVPDEVPLDVLLGPGAVQTTTRRFVLPAGARAVGLVTGHGGPYCGPMDVLEIGSAGCLFGRPTMIGLGRGGRSRASCEV